MHLIVILKTDNTILNHCTAKGLTTSCKAIYRKINGDLFYSVGSAETLSLVCRLLPEDFPPERNN